MFLDYYKLKEQPFGVSPDPRFLYLSPTHREALASLFYGVEAGRGFLALIAQPGMGKTTLLFQLLERLREAARTVFLFQTQCDSRELIRYLLADMGIKTNKNDLVEMHEQLNEILLREMRAGKRFVLIIDEAHNLDDTVLETVRLLSDFETPRTKLMQIVLAGQPPLAAKLARPPLEQLRQRISIVGRLEALAPDEVKRYIDHRMFVAGYEGGPLFSGDALALIARASKGIPRSINNLCFNALSLGCAKNTKKINETIVQEVINDLDLESIAAPRTSNQPKLATPLPKPKPEPEVTVVVPPRPVASAPPVVERRPRVTTPVPAFKRPRRHGWLLRVASAAGFMVMAGGLWLTLTGRLSWKQIEGWMPSVVRELPARLSSERGPSQPSLTKPTMEPTAEVIQSSQGTSAAAPEQPGASPSAGKPEAGQQPSEPSLIMKDGQRVPLSHTAIRVRAKRIASLRAADLRSRPRELHE